MKVSGLPARHRSDTSFCELGGLDVRPKEGKNGGGSRGTRGTRGKGKAKKKVMVVERREERGERRAESGERRAERGERRRKSAGSEAWRDGERAQNYNKTTRRI